MDEADAGITISEFLEKAQPVDYAILVGCLLLFFLAVYFFTPLISKKRKSIHSISHFDYFKTKNTEKWVRVKAKVVRTTFAHMEGDNLYAQREISSFDITNSRADFSNATVAVVEYPSPHNGKMTPVTISVGPRVLKKGDEVEILYNPDNPLEAALAD